MDELESAAWTRFVAVLELLPAALDAQLQRDSQLTHFEFSLLTMLRFAPGSTMRMKQLARATNATLPRLSHVVSRLGARGFVERAPSADDRRANDATLTDAGRRALIRATPGHLETVRRLVLEPLDRDQLQALAGIAAAIGRAVDPSGAFGAAIDGDGPEPAADGDRTDDADRP
ncbi:MAG: MarR family transcriptional regulator [Naasia sp.]|nr:MarR family transcriptional regulator [Naasia sp.]